MYEQFMFKYLWITFRKYLLRIFLFRRRGRKSWFDKDSMAAAGSLDTSLAPTNYDVMIVDHFSRPPKVDFEDTLQGTRIVSKMAFIGV